MQGICLTWRNACWVFQRRVPAALREVLFIRPDPGTVGHAVPERAASSVGWDEVGTGSGPLKWARSSRMSPSTFR
jgi:hypothetical protein